MMETAECCSHSLDEHEVLGICQFVTHYPDEDYPCICDADHSGQEVCGACDHGAEFHSKLVVCRPASGHVCGCVRPLS